ncbi:ThuA domain-containing protein [Neobacillus sp. 3P2-tot-E-2]|uniref:ThuA domain-containing protein n=1 Tax=Neobacillus sp. 3P2-tot-E-2 TaxID=3132212 RepID=UPI0039A12F80
MVRLAAVLGDYYHSYEWAKQTLETALNEGKQDVQIDYCQPKQLPEVLRTKPDAVILFKENRYNPLDENTETWMTEELSLVITNYVENGGNWLAWHSGLASYPVEGSYVKMVKGSFLYHPEKQQIVHYKAFDGNTVVPSSTAFELVDEHYFVDCDKENTNVFLVSESIDGQSDAGWFHRYGEGKVCCLTPAHNKDGLLNENFLNVLRDCVNWLILR